jgi:hypothetical protein
MPTATAIAVVLAFLAGCVTAVVGIRVGHGSSSLPVLLDWAALTLVLQLSAACLAVVHARAARVIDDGPEAPPRQPADTRTGAMDPPRPLP